MRTSLAPRLLGAGVVAAGLVAAAGGLTAAGALGALDPGAGSAAIVTHQPGTRTVTLEPGNTDLKRAAYSAAYDEQIWLERLAVRLHPVRHPAAGLREAVRRLHRPGRRRLLRDRHPGELQAPRLTAGSGSVASR